MVLWQIAGQFWVKLKFFRSTFYHCLFAIVLDFLKELFGKNSCNLLWQIAWFILLFLACCFGILIWFSSLWPAKTLHADLLPTTLLNNAKLVERLREVSFLVFFDVGARSSNLILFCFFFFSVFSRNCAQRIQRCAEGGGEGGRKPFSFLGLDEKVPHSGCLKFRRKVGKRSAATLSFHHLML